MISSLLTLPALGRLILQRLASRPVLTLLALAGIVLAVGLLTSAAFFSQAVDRVILNQELVRLTTQTGRSPFTTRVYFLPSSRFPVGIADAERLGRSVAGTLADEVGLPIARQGLTVESGGLLLLPPADDTRYQSGSSHLTTVNTVYIEDVAEHLSYDAGDPLDEEEIPGGDVLSVWMHAELAAELGTQAGEHFQIAANLRQAPRTIVIRGLWRAHDPTDPFWFSNPNSAFRSGLLITRQSYISQIEPMLAAKAGFVHWQITLDEARVNPVNARQYADGFEHGMVVINQYLPGARLDVSPLDSLRQFVQRQSTLTLVLLGFHVPGLVFLLYFLVLIGLIITRWQARETALLVSRGMSGSLVLGLTLIEVVILCLVGVPLGIGFGMLLARWMGNTVSFLQFAERPPLPVSLQGLHWALLGSALLIALLARLLPLWGAARQSVVEQAREGARPLRPPAWQRFYLDLILVLPTYYAYDQLAKRGTLALRAGDSPDSLFQDPLLIIVPALFILTVSLLSMRIFPWLMRLFDLIASRTPWLTLHLALRQLARSSHHYLNPLLLVVVALGMGVYTRSMAASLDQWLVDQIYYRVGTDLAFQPLPPAGPDGALTLPPDAIFIPPKDDFAALPGVAGATRVGDYRARILGGERELSVRMLAIDRVDFSRVAWFRRDFAPDSLGGLMNALAITPENVLVPRSLLVERRLNMGDTFNLRVTVADEYDHYGTFQVAGVYDYFPTVQPDTATLIGNLEHLFTEAGSEFNHQIWLRLDPNTDRAKLRKEIELMGLTIGSARDAAELVEIEQAKMERVGIFGTLTVGFIAATVMAILALFVHSYASMQDRLYQFGVMRAIGLRHRQVISQVALEYGVLTAFGAFVGALIGLTCAELFTPFFRIPSSAGAPPPPLIPLIQTEATVQFALLFIGLMVLTELVVLIHALSKRLFDALRMGHQG